MAEDRISGGTTTTRWTLCDPEGSIRDVIENSSVGAVVDHVVYDSFGQIVSETNPNERSFATYTGAPTDAETGLVYLHHRYHDPQSGRWLSQDPMGFAAGDVNLYRYVGNSPVMRTDASGLCADDKGWWETFSDWAMGNNPKDAEGKDWVDHLHESMMGYGNAAQDFLEAPGKALRFMGRMYASEANDLARNGNVVGATALLGAARLAEGAAAVASAAADPNQVIAEALQNPRVQGAVGMVQGVTEMAIGATGLATTGVTGVGAVVSVATIVHGADTASAGLHQLVTGEVTPSISVTMLTQLTGSQQTAHLIDGGISIGLTFGTNMAIEGAILSRGAALEGAGATAGRAAGEPISDLLSLGARGDYADDAMTALAKTDGLAPLQRNAALDALPKVPDVQVTFSVGGQSFSDVNPLARASRSSGPTLPGLRGPNSDLSTMHAEIGAMKQALDAGVEGGHGVLVLKGKAVCPPYCRGDVKTVARNIGLDSLTVVDADGTIYHFPTPESLRTVRGGGAGWSGRGF